MQFDEDASVSYCGDARRFQGTDELASIQAPIPARLKAKASTRAPLAIRSVLVANALFFSTYILLRQPILKLIVTSFVGSWARSVFRDSAAGVLG